MPLGPRGRSSGTDGTGAGGGVESLSSSDGKTGGTALDGALGVGKGSGADSAAGCSAAVVPVGSEEVLN